MVFRSVKRLNFRVMLTTNTRLLGMLCFYVLMWASCHISAQATIGGTINLYTPVTSIGCSQLSVASSAGFAAGDRVLIIQMKGAGIDTSNTSQFGNVIQYNNSGNYEFATIASVSGNVINLSYTLINAYTVSGFVQLIRVPQYASPTVSSVLTCAPWNGSTGGVLVLEASGTLTLNADIDVSGKGFRGGTQCTNPDGGCGSGYSDYYYAVSSGFGAEKGEGIAMVSSPKRGGRGALGSGGGGGNKHNSGGGGGGNFSAGGHGGNEANFCPPTAVGGDGGKGLDYVTQHKVFMGGGGGCSDNNNGVGTPGTNGGGIIIIRAAAINAGSASAIRANGIDVTIIPNGIGDGAGGGGAGGAILLDVPNMTGTIAMQANGGAGGGQNCTYGSCFGPGGGGGTGFIATSASALPAGTTPTQAAGLAGVDIYPGSPCYNASYGATAGQAATGGKMNYVFVEGQSTASVSLNAGSSATICAGDSAVIGASALAGYTYNWSPASGLSSASVANPKASPAATTIYTLGGTAPGGCAASSTVQVSVLPNPPLNLLNQAICPGDTALIGTVALAGVSYSWSPAAFLSNPQSSSTRAFPNVSTIYTLTAVNAQGNCTRTATVQVSMLSSPVVNAGNSSTICAGDSAAIGTAPLAGYIYSWSPAAGLSSASAANPKASPAGTTIFTLSVHNSSGCTGSGTVQVTLIPNPALSLSSSQTICPGDTAIIGTTASAGISYSWSPASHLSSPQSASTQAFPNTSTIYTLTAVNATGNCSRTATVQVLVLNNLVANTGSSKTICEGDSVMIGTAPVSGLNYSWTPQGSLSSASVSDPIAFPAYTTTYTLTVNSTSGNCAETASVLVTVVTCDTLSSITIPNVFTPNGDGVNDHFKISASGLSIHCSIYNRWGQKLYEWSGTDGYWNGKGPQGNDAPDGTYYYILEVSGYKVNKTYKGFLTLGR